MTPVSAAEPGAGAGAEAMVGSVEVSGGRTLRGGAWNFLNRALPQLFTLALSIIIARFLGPAGMGRQSYIAFVAIAVATVCTGGFGNALLRCIAEALGRGDGASVRDVVGWAYRLQLGGAVLAAGVLAAFAVTGSQPTLAWALAGVTCATIVLQSTPNGVLSAAQRWRQTSMVSLVVGAAAVPATLAVLALGGGISGVFAVEAVAGIVGVAWVSREARRALDAISRKRERNAQLRSQVLRLTWQTSAGVILTLVIWRRSEFFFLDRYSTDAQIALYSIAFASISGLMMVPEAVGAAISPVFATLFGAGQHDRIGTAYGRALRLTLTASLPVAAIAFAVGPALIALVYGGAYSGTAPVLRIMLLLFPLIPPMTLSNAVLLGVGRLMVPLTAGIFAAVLTIVGDVLLIPGHAAVGAAIANTCGQVGAAVPVIVAGVRVSGAVHVDWPVLTKVAVASALAGAAAYGTLEALGGAAGALGGAAVGGIVFVVLGLILRILTRADAEALSSALPGSPAGVSARLALRFGG